MVDHGLTLSFFSLKDTVEAARVEAAGLRGGQVTAPDRHHIEMINTVLTMGTSPLLTTDGPLWYRGFDTWTEDEGRQLIQGLLSRYGARRFVTAHSIQKTGRISARFDGHEFLIDTAMSSVCTNRTRLRARDRRRSHHGHLQRLENGPRRGDAASPFGRPELTRD